MDRQLRRRLQPPWISLNLLFCCSLLPMAWAAVTIPPYLESQPPKGEVLFTVNHDPDQDPDPFTLPCKADGLPAPSYSWVKDGQPFDPNDDEDDEGSEGRVEMLDGEGTIIFHDPRPGDEGDYQCIAENSVGKVKSEVSQVRRAVLGNFPKSDPRVVTARIGQTLSLPCTPPEGYPEPTLHWVLQNADGSLRSLNSERLTVDEEGTLWFSYVKLEDASEDALYACAASSATSWYQMFLVQGEEGGVPEMHDDPPEEGDDITSLNMPTEYRMGNWVYLNVSDEDDATIPEMNIPPVEQHISPSEVTTLAGEDVKLYCIYGGYPVPEVKWWRESRADVENDQLEHNGKVLLLENIEEEDMGSYYCQAENEDGKGDIHQFTVYVEAAPHFVVSPEVVNLPEGETATFHCEARGDPEPKITWTKDGQVMDSHDTTIVFDTLNLDHKAVISCNASNAHGYVYKSVYLNVLSLPPEWMTEPEDVSVLEHTSAVMECEAYGSPDPDIIWARMDDDEKVEIHDEDPRYDIKDHRLMIKSVDENSDGRYVCTATNKFGTIESEAEVSIRKRTHAEVNVINDRVNAGNHVSLDCKVTFDENLDPEITWLHDDIEIDLDDDNYRMGERDTNGDDDEDDEDRDMKTWALEMMEVHGDDSGVYTCRVKTDLDTVNADLILTVEDVPNPPHLKNVECSDRNAFLTWASGGDNNAPLQGYVIQYVTQFHPDDWKDAENQISPSKTSFSSRFRTVARVELSPGMNYTFRVLAFNRVGISEPSEETEECASPGLPPDHHPYNVTVVPNAPGSMLISWEAMDQEEHNGPDFHYKVLWQSLTDEDDNDTSPVEAETPDDDDDEDDEDMEDGWHYKIIEDWEENEIEIDGLPAYEEYMVKVEAHNVYGDADEPVDISVEHSGQDVPDDAPTEVDAIDADATEVVLTWEPVDEESVHGKLLGYQIEVWEADKDENAAQRILTTGPATRAELTDLKPYTEYKARIKAVNSAYSGPASDHVSFKTAEGESGPVTNFEVQQLGSQSLLVNWDSPEEENGVTQGYVVKYRQVDSDGHEGPLYEHTSEDLKPDNTLIKLANLEQGAKYKVSVAAVNGAGDGEESTMEIQMEEMEPSRPAVPIFTWSLIQDHEEKVIDRDGDGDVDEEDIRNQDIIIGDTNNDGKVDRDDVLDVDEDGDVDEDDFNVADINNDGIVSEADVLAADRDQDGDVDESDIGDEDGDGDFDGDDVIAADEDGDGDIDASDDDEEDTLLEDRDQDGDIDRDDVTDINRDGVIDEKDFKAADVDDDGDIDEDDLRIADKDGDGDVDAADVTDLDGDGRVDGDDMDVNDKDGDGDIDKKDYALRRVILTDIDGDGDIDEDDVIDTDNDGDIDEDDKNIADIDNDGDVDGDDVRAADRDGDGDVDVGDIGDEDGDGDFDGMDVLAADEDGDGDIDAEDDDEEHVLLEDRDGDGDIDRDDVIDIDGDGDIDIEDFAAADVDDDGDVDSDDIAAADRDGDGDLDAADITDFDGDGRIDSVELDLNDRDNDGDIDAKDFKFRNTLLADTDGDGDIDEDDVLDIDGDGDIDEEDKKAADIDDDGDIDEEDVKQGDRDGDRDIDGSDIGDVDGDGTIDEGDLDVKDRDGDGDIDSTDFKLRNVILQDTDGDGDIDIDDVLDTDGDGDIDQEDIDVADIDNDGDVDINDIRAADRDHDGDIDNADIGDEDGDGDIDGDDVIAADEDGDGDIDAGDDDGESIILGDIDGDGVIDKGDVKDINGDGVIDERDFEAADVDNDGDFDADDIRAADRDGDLDVDAADITDVTGDGIVDGRDLMASDKDGDGDIDRMDIRNLDVLLKDTDRDGDIDEDDVIDTDFDGDIDQADINAADVDNDGDVDRDDVIAADIDGDGDIDFRDIGDVDGDGDIDGDDLEKADKDGDGDVDAADEGKGVNVKINWKPDFDKHPGVDFYVERRVEGMTSWQKSPVEDEHLHQTLTGLDPRRSYEVRIVAKDGPYETPSELILIPATEEQGREYTSITECAEDAGSFLYCSVHLTPTFDLMSTTPHPPPSPPRTQTPHAAAWLTLGEQDYGTTTTARLTSAHPSTHIKKHKSNDVPQEDIYDYQPYDYYNYEYTDDDHYPTALEGSNIYPDWTEHDSEVYESLDSERKDENHEIEPSSERETYGDMAEIQATTSDSLTAAEGEEFYTDLEWYGEYDDPDPYQDSQDEITNLESDMGTPATEGVVVTTNSYPNTLEISNSDFKILEDEKDENIVSRPKQEIFDISVKNETKIQEINEEMTNLESDMGTPATEGVVVTTNSYPNTLEMSNGDFKSLEDEKDENIVSRPKQEIFDISVKNETKIQEINEDYANNLFTNLTDIYKTSENPSAINNTIDSPTNINEVSTIDDHELGTNGKNSSSWGDFWIAAIKKWKKFWDTVNEKRRKYEEERHVKEKNDKKQNLHVYTGNGRHIEHEPHEENIRGNEHPQKADEAQSQGYVDALHQIINNAGSRSEDSWRNGSGNEDESHGPETNGRKGHSNDISENIGDFGGNEYRPTDNYDDYDYWNQIYKEYEDNEEADYLDYYSTIEKDDKDPLGKEDSGDYWTTKEKDDESHLIPDSIDGEDYWNYKEKDDESPLSIDYEDYWVTGKDRESHKPEQVDYTTSDDTSQDKIPELSPGHDDDDKDHLYGGDDEISVYEDDKEVVEGDGSVYEDAREAIEEEDGSVYVDAGEVDEEEDGSVYEDAREVVEGEDGSVYDYNLEGEDDRSNISIYDDYSSSNRVEDDMTTFVYENYEDEDREADVSDYDYSVTSKEVDVNTDNSPDGEYEEHELRPLQPAVKDEKKEEDAIIHELDTGKTIDAYDSDIDDRDRSDSSGGSRTYPDKPIKNKHGSSSSSSQDSSSQSSSSGDETEDYTDDTEKGDQDDTGEYGDYHDADDTDLSITSINNDIVTKLDEDSPPFKESSTSTMSEADNRHPTGKDKFHGTPRRPHDRQQTPKKSQDEKEGSSAGTTTHRGLIDSLSPEEYNFEFDYDAYTDPLNYNEYPEMFSSEYDDAVKRLGDPSKKGHVSQKEFAEESEPPEPDEQDGAKHIPSSSEVLDQVPGEEHTGVKLSHTEMETPEDPTVGAVMEETNPILWTWFIIAVMAAVTMICIVFFSMWVYSHRIARVAELRAALYEGYEPPQKPDEDKKGKDVDLEANKPDEVEEEMSANYQRNGGAFGNRRSWYHVQLAQMMKRQETIQSVDSFASHDDDFAEYGDESMGRFNDDGSLIHQKV